MKIFTKKEIIPIILIIVAFIVGLQLYSQLPNQVPSHWNAQGEVDAWSGKGFAVLFAPILALAIYLLMTFIPLIDPLKKRYKDFAVYYFWLKVLLVVFLLALYGFTLAIGMGFKMNILYFILPAMSILYIIIGLFLPKIKKNYFVGIRTPWTLHSEKVWDKTHKTAGKFFIVAGIIALLGLFIQKYAFGIFIITILAAALGSVVYSYLVFRKIGEKK